MHFFRKQPNSTQSLEQSPLPPLDIQLNLAPDGSYPARLIYLQEQPQGNSSSSFWLPNHQTRIIVPKVFAVLRTQQIATIIPYRRGVFINGELVRDERVLQDGDFIVWRKNRYIFQADPAKDRRKRFETMQKEDPDFTMEIAKPSENLRRLVVMNTVGISLNKGEDFVRWDEIAYLKFRFDSDKKVGDLSVVVDQQTKPLKSAVQAISQDEFRELLAWLRFMMPFDLSWLIAFFMEDEMVWSLFEAYRWASFEKILIPYEEGQRPLPATVDFIYARTPCLVSIAQVLLMVGVLAALYAVVRVISDNKGDLAKTFLIVFSTAFISMLVLLGLMWGEMTLQVIVYEWWQRRKKRKQKTESQEQSEAQ